MQHKVLVVDGSMLKSIIIEQHFLYIMSHVLLDSDALLKLLGSHVALGNTVVIKMEFAENVYLGDEQLIQIYSIPGRMNYAFRLTV